MSNFLWGFVIGAILMDYVWAQKFGIPKLFWTRMQFWFHKIYQQWKYR